MDDGSAVVVIGELRFDDGLRKLFDFEYDLGDESLSDAERIDGGYNL